MKTTITYLVGVLLICFGAQLLISCDPWAVPAKKIQRNCVKPSGNLNAQTQQKQVNFSISNTTGTIDQIAWDFGNGSTTVTSGMTVLYTYPTSGTYAVKANLTNTCDNGTTLQTTIIVSDAVLPTVALQPVTEVSTNAANVRMTVTSNGNATISRYGICYSSTNQMPEVDKNDATTIVTGSVAINNAVLFSLPGLLPNTTYYVRSFATNSAGTAYSTPTQSFSTATRPIVALNGTASVGVTTAGVNFVLTNSGSPAAVQYGIVYSSTNSTPDLINSPPGVTVTSPNPNVSTVVNLPNLTPNTLYYYRPYARLASGEIVYGSIASFTTLVDAVAQDLIAFLPFTNQSLLDISGNNNHAIGVNNPGFTTDRKGVANAAILFNGQNNYISMTDNSSLRPMALSISLWIKPITVDRKMQIYNKSNFSDSKNEMYSSTIKPNENGGAGITILTDVKQRSNCQPVIGWESFPLSSAIQINTWHHMVFTFTGRSARMYFDGILLYSRDDLPENKIDDCPGGNLRFGAQIQQFPQYFNGAMDEIRIYRRALLASEVKTLSEQ